MIMSGQLKPGSKLNQDQIAASTGVSKLPVREAVIQLASEGLVTNVPRRGAFVAALEPDDIRDHYRIFASVSGIAAERAATELTDEGIERLTEVLRRMDTSRDMDELEALNIEFHRTINLAGGSRRLVAMLQSLVRSMPSKWYGTIDGDWVPHASRDHRAILEALRERDGARARDAMIAHLASGAEPIIAALQAQGFWE
jgi:DNA-binding GntR family transcriptional regulator